MNFFQESYKISILGKIKCKVDENEYDLHIGNQSNYNSLNKTIMTNCQKPLTEQCNPDIILPPYKILANGILSYGISRIYLT